MRLLLDTNALIWYMEIVETSKLGHSTKSMIAEANVVYVSSITMVECHIKTMIGKLDVPMNFGISIRASGFEVLEFNETSADGMRGLPEELARHDPFDRMLLTQAKANDLLFLTADRSLLALGYDWLRDARQ